MLNINNILMTQFILIFGFLSTLCCMISQKIIFTKKQETRYVLLFSITFQNIQTELKKKLFKSNNSSKLHRFEDVIR